MNLETSGCLLLLLGVVTIPLMIGGFFLFQNTIKKWQGGKKNIANFSLVSLALTGLLLLAVNVNLKVRPCSEQEQASLSAKLLAAIPGPCPCGCGK